MDQLNFWDVTTGKCKCKNKAEFIYKDMEYCSSCLIKKFKIKVVDYIKYYKNGTFLRDINFDIIEVFHKIDSTVKEIHN